MAQVVLMANTTEMTPTFVKFPSVAFPTKRPVAAAAARQQELELELEERPQVQLLERQLAREINVQPVTLAVSPIRAWMDRPSIV